MTQFCEFSHAILRSNLENPWDDVFMEAMAGSYLTAFLLGLFSTAHCIAMCGSVIGALTLSLPKEIRESHRQMFPFVLNYNLGRIISYTVAGAIVGLLSSPLTQINGHIFLRWLSVFVMIGMGLWLAGWFPKFARMEQLGAPIWRWLQPVGNKLLPVRKVSQAFSLGIVWGWLPCGMVYGALAVAATTGSVVDGGFVMLAFGVGTLPAVLGAGLFTGMLASLARNPSFRKAAGLLIIVMAIATFFIPMPHHHEHDATDASMEHQHSESTVVEHDDHQSMEMMDQQQESMVEQNSEMMDMQGHDHDAAATMTEQPADPHAGHMH